MNLTNQKFKEIFPWKTPRTGQKQLIQKIINTFQNGKKYIILDAPTGIGKSVIGYSVAKYFGNAYILTSQKILQDQYFKDFKAPIIMGRANYVCQKNAHLNCQMGACYRNSKKYCKYTNGQIKCPYIVSRDICLSHQFSNINYSYFLAISKCIGQFQIPQKNLIICDECHNLQTQLIKIGTLKLTEKTLQFLGIVDIDFPNISDSKGSKCNWLINELLPKIVSNYIFIKDQISKLNELKVTNEFKRLVSKFSCIQKMVVSIKQIKQQIQDSKIGSDQQNIFVSQTSEYIQFKPLFAINGFKQTIDKKADKVLFMSATVLNKNVFCKNLGLDPKDVEYINCDSLFPIENRLIHYTPVGSMSFKQKNITIPKMIKNIDKILKKYKNVKGIIHTVNYEVAEKIIQGLSFSSQSYRLLMPKGEDKQFMLNSFYASNKPYVLISPSLMEGIDLKQDLSRFCIICKVPYMNLGDPWVKERMEYSQEWYMTNACINLIQMSGRSIRSQTDFADTYILDEDFIKLALSCQNIFPKWWKDSVVY